MISDILVAIGGLGLFLLGMAVMTDGLTSLAGESLRKLLARFTKDPVTGAATGTVSTALIQSSSATTVMAIGFVGAGLMTFPQALGIIFGANIGTTITGWLVALVGFKLSLTEIVMPLIFLGAIMRLFGQRRVAAFGFALAGFGLVFAGIATLQDGLEAFKDIVTPASFPDDTFSGRLLLVLIGVAITLVTQSSSAGVATAITAVHVGNISLAQGCAMVIGMDVGTTVTAAMAAIGSNVDGRRTGIAHVIYNTMTGIMAFVLLPLFMRGWDGLAPNAVLNDPEIALVAFHTTFNTLGVLLVLPFTRQFAQLIMHLIPSREDDLTRRLEPSLVKQPNVAIDGAIATLISITDSVFTTLGGLLRSAGAEDHQEVLSGAEQACGETRKYLSKLNVAEGDDVLVQRHRSAIHVLDHLIRLIARCNKKERVDAIRGTPALDEFVRKLSDCVVESIAETSAQKEVTSRLEELWLELEEMDNTFRQSAIEQTTTGTTTAGHAIDKLDAMRWLRRVSYHAWRIMYHLPMGDEDPAVVDPVEDSDSEPD